MNRPKRDQKRRESRMEEWCRRARVAGYVKCKWRRRRVCRSGTERSERRCASESESEGKVRRRSEGRPIVAAAH